MAERRACSSPFLFVADAHKIARANVHRMPRAFTSCGDELGFRWRSEGRKGRGEYLEHPDFPDTRQCQGAAQ